MRVCVFVQFTFSLVFWVFLFGSVNFGHNSAGNELQEQNHLQEENKE